MDPYSLPPYAHDPARRATRATHGALEPGFRENDTQPATPYPALRDAALREAARRMRAQRSPAAALFDALIGRALSAYRWLRGRRLLERRTLRR